MDESEKAIVDLVRMGVKGDATSVRQYAARLLRRAPKKDGGDNAFRDALSRLVLDDTAVQRLARAVPREIVQSENEAPLPLTTVELPVSARAPLLDADAEMAVQELIAERRHAGALARAGVEPTRTLLLTGAPGVGKTMTARYLASALDLPLVSVDLAALMSSFLGKTGQNLRLVLDYARRHQCVFLLDEFDALGKRRDDPTDVGELKRIVNVLLLELERWPTHSLLIAATNHPELLDRAIWRRFERVVAIEPPSGRLRDRLFAGLLSEYGLHVPEADRALCVRVFAGDSPADIETFVKTAARTFALREAADIGVPSQSQVLAALALDRLRRTHRPGEDSRMVYAGLARDLLRWSQRTIGAKLGISHVTVGKLLKEWDAHPASRSREKSSTERDDGARTPAQAE